MSVAFPTIRRVMLHRIRIPLEQVYVSAMYVMGEVFRTIIEVETDDGCAGIGEAPGSEEVFQIAGRLARSFLGQNPLERGRLQHEFAASAFDNRNGRNGWSAYGGLELALWDWAGNYFSIPAVDLIGTRVRDVVAVVCPVPAIILNRVEDPRTLPALFEDLGRISEVVEYCLAQREAYGFNAFKYKSAGVSAAWDVELMSALRRALGPDVGLRWDPNAAYPISAAAAVCGRLEDLNLEFYEDPTEGISGMAALRSRVRTPLATNMCVVQLDHLASAIRCRPADVLLVDLYMWGGIENYLTMSAAAGAYGFEIAVHSFFETGIGTAANLHLAGALAPIRRPSDCGLHILSADVVESGPLSIERGRMQVPDGPGWGVTLNRSAVASLSVDSLEIAAGTSAVAP